MPGERYEHIFLHGPSRTEGFTNPRRGHTPRFPTRDRAEHSALLERRIEETWQSFDNQQDRRRHAVAHVEHHGAYIEFESDPGYELVVKSLEDIRSGVRIQNVRIVGDEEEQLTLATVYVPNNKRGHFLNKIRKYETEETRGGNPKNQRLINSISDIRLAVLESFWRTNEQNLIPCYDPEWVEIWLNSDSDEVIARFSMLLQSLSIESMEGLIKFPERSVILIQANRSDLEQLLESSADIAEMRAAKKVASFYIESDNFNQTERVMNLLERIESEDDTNVAVCILDSGINNGHSLIQPVLADSDIHTVRPEWGGNDDSGHGTLMAGIAAYGDLLSLLEEREPIRILHHLESSKILPPPPEENPKRLWGFITSQGVNRAEIQAPNRKRIICLAITAIDDRDLGRPSSWSGALDEIASGCKDGIRRLIIISAGNVDHQDNWRNYPNDNLTNDIHDPGQAWNALTIGAFTEKTHIVDNSLSDYTPIAPSGGLSPYSTTSTTWPTRRWPIKPEVVLEGGNVASGPNDSIFDTEDLKLISTYHKPHIAQFAPFEATSAASAQAAWLAARIQAQYPDAWPETIRALVVHSANWTETMKRQFLTDETKRSYAKLIRICGYGVPDLDRALYCMMNSLTLISQASLQPYDKRNGRYVTQDLHLYTLPWPAETLQELRETQVTMRVTLSYFIEPGPGEIGWKDRYRYASHALRFDVNGAGESEEEFMQRVNAQARADHEHPGTEGAGQRWKIGEARNVGSIHSDIWTGRAADLAASNMIVVYPAVGWWRERTHLHCWNRQSRYSLLVSIYTPELDVDIYTPVANLIRIPIQPIPIEITVNR
ncbi:MAG: S8 family peptidase [Candidatus Aegiribacteria sp.]|nr:S8 family peptidase [Candidatus Aegiribacteria sp.]